MATYKVLQDIEAEDKLLGPLTPRQAVYGGIAAVSGYLTYLVIVSPVPYLAVIFLPFIAVAGFFAFPWRKEQSTEVWALAKIRFAVKPRKRIWNQSGARELVSVTVPKRPPSPYRRNMNQNEVQSRLKALADTIDSRGWATKNVPAAVYGYGQQASMAAGAVTVHPSDRLTAGSVIPQEVQGFTTYDADDMFDLESNPLAQDFDAKITASDTARREQAVQQLTHPQDTVPAANQPTSWYIPQPAQVPPQPAATPAVPAMAMPVTSQPNAAEQPVSATGFMGATAPDPAVITPLAAAGAITMASNEPTFTTVPVAAASTPEEEAFAKYIKQKREDEAQTVRQSYSRLKRVQPLGESEAASQPPDSGRSNQQTAAVQPVAAVPQPVVNPNTAYAMTSQPDAVTMELANNNDLNVATLARQAKERRESANEVVVSLH